MIFGGLVILHAALVFSDKLLLAILHGITAVFFAIVTYTSWDMAKIDRLISKSHQETERRRNVP